MLKFYALLFAGLAVLSVVGFVGFAAWCGAKEAATILKKLWKSWRGRQVSSAKDRIKRVVRVLVLFALTSSANATLNTSQEVIGPHKNWTPVAGPPVIVKFSTDYTGPTATPTPTFTWNATTTRTQPPTSTPTATNTPDMYRSDVRYIRFSDYPTPMSNLVIPAASPTPIVFAATTPGYHHKIEACAQNIGTAAGVLTAGGMTYNFSPYDPRTLFLFTPANGAITIDTSYVAGVTIRLNLMHAIVRDGQ